MDQNVAALDFKLTAEVLTCLNEGYVTLNIESPSSGLRELAHIGICAKNGTNSIAGMAYHALRVPALLRECALCVRSCAEVAVRQSRGHKSSVRR